LVSLTTTTATLDREQTVNTEAESGDSIAAAQPSEYRKTGQDDSIGAFFKEMSRYPLLKPEEELELARRIRQGVEVAKREDELETELGRPPTLEELSEDTGISPREIRKTLQRSRIAKRKMIRSNLRLVVSIAKHYLNRGMPFLDLIQEGALGLSRATEKFDPEKGYKFSTYAYWWIRQGITRSLANDGRTIRLPIHILERLNHLKKAYRELGQELGRKPNEEELAEHMELSVKKVRQLQRVSRRSLSLNRCVGTEENTEILDLLEDTDSRSPEAQTSELMMRQEIRDVLDDVLTDRERDVLVRRYGLLDGKIQTLQEVSQTFDLSRERVRQIQTRAMRKLRRPQVARRLRGWLN